MSEGRGTKSIEAGGETTPTLRIFVSSPGDVKEEREVTLAVIRRLQGWFRGRLLLKPVFWEEEPLGATAGFQEEIDRRAPPSAADIALFVLWSRLGTPLSEKFILPDGRRPTGTEWEFYDATRANQDSGTPYILVYKKSAEVVIRLGQDGQKRAEAEQQFHAVQHFFDEHFRDEKDFSFKGSYHRFESAAEFGPLLETHLTKLLTERLGHATATWHESPFRGLRAFEYEHAPIFFGRSRAMHEVRQALRTQTQAGRAFVLVLGMSGNGKSSLVRAGLLPLLQVPGVIEESLVGGTCRRAVMRPGDCPTPLHALASALLADEALPELRDNATPEELAALVGKSPEALVPLIRGALSRVTPSPARLVLVVDQLEELFTGSEERQQGREAFVTTVDVLARSGLVYVVATLRSDFYPAFSAVPTLMALKEGAGHYDLTAPDAGEMAQIIRRPAQVAGLVYETDPETKKPLDEVLLAEAAAGPDALPLLEYALDEIYERRDVKTGLLTIDAYRTLGGVEGALATRARQEWAALPQEAQAALASVVRALVDVGEGGERTATKRRAVWEEATRAPGAKALVERFVAARLFVADQGARGERVVSVIHEALLRKWKEMADQIKAEVPLLQTRTRVRAAAAAWDARGRPSDDLDAGRKLAEDEDLVAHDFDLTATERAFVDASSARARRVQKLKRLAIGAIGVLGVGALLLALFAFGKQREASNALVEISRLSDIKRVRDLETAAARLSLRNPDIVEQTEAWLAQAADLGTRLAAHRQALAELRAQATATDPDWEFATEEEAWRHGALTELVERIEPLGREDAEVPARVRRVQTLALEVREAAQGADWGPAIERIAANPEYRGLRLVPQFGLVPLGPDAASGLEEFAYVGSGAVPVRAEGGGLVHGDGAAIVLVLIPGGTFWMGAQKEDEGKPNHEPTVEGDWPLVSVDESPVHEVTLAPYFLAKHECTQAQWRALSGGASPSRFGEVAEEPWGALSGGAAPRVYDEGAEAPRRPVEQVSWSECKRTLEEHGLALPSEVAWEYACRARTATSWWTGTDEKDLGAACWYGANADGTTHPVGEKDANAFGLHDVHGNVWEWCEDEYHDDYGGAPHDGSAWVDGSGSGNRVDRGGSWVYNAGHARSANRSWGDPGARYGDKGCRPARPITP